MAGNQVIAASAGAIATLALSFISTRLLKRRGRARKATIEDVVDSKTNDNAEAGIAGSEVVGVNLQLKPNAFGSPVNGTTPASSGPGTPKLKDPEQDVDSDTHRADQSSRSTTGVDAANLKEQLAMLKQMQEENARLREFMSQHLQTSAKVAALEQENQQLVAAKGKLESELDELKSKPFALSSGSDLQQFKGLLAARMPSEARSACSDVDVLSALNGAASVDGAATVADFAAARKRSPSFFSELASLLMMAPSNPSTSSNSKSVTGGANKLSSSASVASTSKGDIKPNGSQAGSVISTTPKPPTPATRPAKNSSLDVGSLLDAWAGGGRL